MKTSAAFKKSWIVLLLPLAFGCAPAFHAETGKGVLESASEAEESLLSKTSTGQQVLQDMKAIRLGGYSLEIRRVTSEVLSALGAQGSASDIKGRAVTILLDESLNLEERAHALAREISRLKDDFDVEDFLASHPEIAESVQDFWENRDVKSLANFDWKVVKFALGVAICKEVRASSLSQKLISEGLRSVKYAQQTTVGKYLDESVFSGLEALLRSLIEDQLTKACSKYSTMSELQNSLAW